MKKIKLNDVQKIVNLAHAKQDFTYPIDDKPLDYNYVVSVGNIYTGKNPSLKFDLNTQIKDVIDQKLYNSIGGWMCSKTGIYYLDYNLHFYNLSFALECAKVNDQICIYDLKLQQIINV